MNCPHCGATIDPNARFCSSCSQQTFVPAYAPAPTRFIRPREGRMIAGVCAAIAMHYGWDVSVVRLITALIVLCGCGSPILLYLIAWIVMPNGPYPFLPPTTPSGPIVS